jgi:multidrug efflux pump subunit AcrA (membrane-fusion protein)
LKFQLNRGNWNMVLLAIIAVAALSSLGYKIMAQQPSENNKKHEVPAQVVQVAPVKTEDLYAVLCTTGVLETRKSMEVLAESTLMVKEIRKKAGSQVAVGEVVLLLDNSEALAQLGKAENNLAVLENNYLQAVKDKVFLMEKRDNARKELQQLEALYQSGEGSFYELENARAEVELIEKQIVAINLNVLDNEVKKARSAVEAAREQLSATVVTSPMEGIILHMGVKEGQTVKEGRPFFKVGENKPPQVLVALSEEDARQVQNGQEVKVYRAEEPEKVVKGQVSFIAAPEESAAASGQNADGKEQKDVSQGTGATTNVGGLDARAVNIKQSVIEPVRTVQVKIETEEEAAEFGSEAQVQVEIILENKAQVLTVPLTAVTEMDGRSVVFVYDDGVAKLREVECGLVGTDSVEIIAGLNQEEQVIISSLAAIEDGTKVDIISELEAQG